MRIPVLLLGLIASLSSTLACSSDPSGSDTGTGGGDSGTGGSTTGSGGRDAGGQGGAGGEGDACSTSSESCALTSCAVPIAGADHAVPCSILSYGSNPPTSGTHYSVWAAYALYDQPVPQGFLVHSLEHSAVILSYNCALAEAAGVDCDALVAELTQFWNDWPEDPLCSASRHRLILAPDPKLDRVFAASAWGYFMKGDCFDPAQVSDFIDLHYGQTYENICASGVDPATYPADCGQ